MELIVFLFVILIFWILPMAVSHKIAKQKNRNYRAWVVIAIFIGWLAPLILVLTSRRDEEVTY